MRTLLRTFATVALVQSISIQVYDVRPYARDFIAPYRPSKWRGRKKQSPQYEQRVRARRKAQRKARRRQRA